MRRAAALRCGIGLCIALLVGCGMVVEAPAPSQSSVAVQQSEPSRQPVPSVQSQLTLSPTPGAPTDRSSPATAAGRHFFVSSDGSDTRTGLSAADALRTIQAALQRAQPGDVIDLAPGEYWEDLRSVTSGTETAPITLRGPQDAIVKGNGKINVVEITHDFLVLEGFTIDGLWAGGDKVDHFRRKLIYANAVTGLTVRHMTLRNAGSACLRLQNQIIDAEVAYTTITTCGVIDFRFAGGGANGEGIYVGTAPNHLGGEASDHSHNNWIHHNIINTQGSECIDIKPGSFDNVVENNQCSSSLKDGILIGGDQNAVRDNEIFDVHEAALVVRGRGNAISNNNIHDNAACVDIKLGAVENLFEHNRCTGKQTIGIYLRGERNVVRDNEVVGAQQMAMVISGPENEIYGNHIHDNADGIRVYSMPQEKLCCNRMRNTGRPVIGTTAYDPAGPDS